MNIIEFLVKHHNLNQSQIAEAVGVSRAQVSKWKSGDSISFEKREALQKLCGAFTDDFEVFSMFGTEESAVYWSQVAQEVDTWSWLGGSPDEDWVHLNVYQVLKALTDSGFIAPNETLEDKKDDEHFLEIFRTAVVYTGTIDKWVDLYMGNYDMDSTMDITEEVFASLADLSVYHIINESKDVPESAQLFSTSTYSKLNQLIHQYCLQRTHNNLPIMEDYFKILTENPEVLNDDFFKADAIDEYISFNDRVVRAEVMALRMQVESLQMEIAKLKAK
ncbi:helix-turn-helix domain-containing protein [Marinomonas communis]|uniref:Helix-turn-helix protein n=1 Tax=Marinomonas communis TaxID=28254 RepID=A0A4R6WXN7_9GAMM|nr:helix-turn-helix transcriptional regulator [Marinomonas communis]TDR05954.1 helix-turn-helix protein [Marinomonas communis]